MENTLIGSLPRHHYIWVDNHFIHDIPSQTLKSPAVWFGLVSYSGRAFGCNVLLESGAIYRNIPVHAIAFGPHAKNDWSPQDAQCWDCYGNTFICHEYSYLSGLDCYAKNIGEGEYLFTVAPIGDGFSAYPEQAKEFTFIKLDNGRLTIQPTNRVLFRERSFTNNNDWKFPTDLRIQKEIYSTE